jgi:hypothetical protein
MKESSDGFLTFLKLCSFLILSATMGTVIVHNVQQANELKKNARVVDVSVSDFLGYGFAYGFGYGYRYGYDYGHAYGCEEFTNTRNEPGDRTVASEKQRETWSESSDPVKRVAGKVGIGLKGVWEAIPA